MDAITDATFGNFLLIKKIGKIIIDATSEITKGYRNPDQKDSFQIRTLLTPRRMQLRFK